MKQNEYWNLDIFNNLTFVGVNKAQIGKKTWNIIYNVKNKTWTSAFGAPITDGKLLQLFLHARNARESEKYKRRQQQWKK